MRGQGELFIETTYRSQYYGIRRNAIEKVRDAGSTPVLVVTPEAAKGIVSDDPFEETGLRPFVVFIDAEDKALEERIRHRANEDDPREREQREADRRFGDCAMYIVRGGRPKEVSDLIAALWKTRDRSGILPGAMITRLVVCGTLLQNATRMNVKGASYDLSLGDEYYYGGRIHGLSKREPILTLAPYDNVIVTSHEVADLPLVLRHD